MYNYYLMADPAPTNSSWPLLAILGVFLIGMMFFSVLPQKRKQKQMAEMSSRIKVGDKIKTIGGIFGTITASNEELNLYTIKSGDTTFEIDRTCVYSMEMIGIKPEIVETDDLEEVEEETVAAEQVKTMKKEDVFIEEDETVKEDAKPTATKKTTTTKKDEVKH